jgi:hypothetical protein
MVFAALFIHRIKLAEADQAIPPVDELVQRVTSVLPDLPPAIQNT